MDILARLILRLTENGNEPDEDILTDCIETAKAAILNRRFPYGDWPTREVVITEEGSGEEITTTETYVEDRYLDLQFRIAMDLYNKIGAEGEISHSENGISRSFESSWISKQLLAEVTPYVGVPL